ncbi:predicted protein, partial [Nematostella vectensis]
GTGLLGLPYVILRGGWAAVMALVVVAFISYYTGNILVECIYDKDGKGNKVRVRSNYREMADASWPKYGGWIAVIIQVIELTLLASLYLVLAASLLEGLTPTTPIPLRIWMVIIAAVGLPTIFFKHFSQVAWISLASVVALTIAVSIILGYGFSISFSWDIKFIPFWETKGAPLALAIIIFSYICHPVLPGIEANMADPNKFNTMLALSYASVFLVKIVFSMCAFLSFSTHISEVITNSLPLGYLKISVNIFLLLSIVLSYPFRVMTIIQVLESVIPDSLISKFPSIVWFIFVRIFVNFLTLIPAVSIPRFALFMAFAGSLTGTCMSFLFPCIFHLALKAPELSNWSKLLDISIIVFGVIAGLLGIL